jgi:two-component system, NtrC family, response regulator GlrR
MSDRRDDQTTDVEPRAELNLTTLRRRPRLEWSDSAGTHAVEIDGRLLVGSAPHVNAVVADRAVSRLHAEIELRTTGVWVRDLGSRNGTFVDGILVESARIPDGGRVKMGAVTFTVSWSAQPMPVPLWPHDRFGPLVARSEGMRELFLRLSQYAVTDSAVLVQGETGTGKELVAQAIHEASSRADGPFVVVDCGALPETLLESELFGHTKGAFTGAVAAREGAFEAANGGTVFLDEIGELPLPMQPKLLRILESQTVRRIGETEHRRVDVRFVCATNRNLSAMVGTGDFREDLFFRIAVLPVVIPPLRDRPEDIPLLLERFLAKKPSVHVERELLQELMAHRFPGNVRELRSFAERAMATDARTAWAMTRGAEVPSRIPPPPPVPDVASSTDVPFKALRERVVDQLEREYIAGLIAKLGRDAGAIAEAADLDRSYVHRLLRKHRL